MAAGICVICSVCGANGHTEDYHPDVEPIGVALGKTVYGKRKNDDGIFGCRKSNPYNGVPVFGFGFGSVPPPQQRQTSLFIGNTPMFAPIREAEEPKPLPGRKLATYKTWPATQLQETHYMKTCEYCKEKTRHDFVTEGSHGLSIPTVFMGKQFYRCRTCRNEVDWTPPPTPPPKIVDLD